MVWYTSIYTNFIKFQLQSMSSKIEQAFEKNNKIWFCLHLHFANSIFTMIFLHFFKNFKNNYFISLIFPKVMWLIPFTENIKDCHKIGWKSDFKKVHLPLKPTWCSCFFLFHSHNPKPKQNHQISSSRAKIRSTQSQACVKYRGNIICNKRNTDVNTGDLKILHKIFSKQGWFSRGYL